MIGPTEFLSNLLVVQFDVNLGTFFEPGKQKRDRYGRINGKVVLGGKDMAPVVPTNDELLIPGIETRTDSLPEPNLHWASKFHGSAGPTTDPGGR